MDKIADDERRVRELSSRIEVLELELEMAKAARDGLLAVNAYVERFADKPTNGATPMRDWNDKSIHQCLVAFAQEHEGIVRTRKAITALVDEKVCRDRRAAHDTVYSTLKRSPRFQWVERGMYRLLVDFTE